MEGDGPVKPGNQRPGAPGANSGEVTRKIRGSGEPLNEKLPLAKARGLFLPSYLSSPRPHLTKITEW